MRSIKVAVVGDYDPVFPPQATLGAALRHAAIALDLEVAETWIPTETLARSNSSEILRDFDGIFGGPGDVHELEGTLQGIRFARENNKPYFGTCAGFQYAVIEFARNVLGIADATSAEFDPSAPQLMLTPLACNIAGEKMTVNIQPNSLAHNLYGSNVAVEEYFCHFGINSVYRDAFVDAGMRISGTDQDNEPRIFELPTHPFFLASLFVPQTSSTPAKPHPLVSGFLAVCAKLPVKTG
jgi:CTP synthase (UTP-ammonia lyase)